MRDTILVNDQFMHDSSEEIYKIIAISNIKLNNEWYYEKCITYKHPRGSVFSRLESDFRQHFIKINK